MRIVLILGIAEMGGMVESKAVGDHLAKKSVSLAGTAHHQSTSHSSALDLLKLAIPLLLKKGFALTSFVLYTLFK